MRFVAAALILTLLATLGGEHASAQNSNSAAPATQRMGPQLRMPNLLRNPLNVHRGRPPVRGFTPAHVANGGNPVKKTEPTPAVRSASKTAELQQVQAYSELPLGTPSPQGEPTPASRPSGIIPQGESVIVDSTPLDINFEMHGDHMVHSGVDVYGDSACGEGGCCGTDCGGCNSCCIDLPRICLPRLSLENFSVFAGVQGFKGPVNRGQDGSFGFSEGFNWGTPILGDGLNLGAQFGLRAVQTNLHGSAFTSENRTQTFITAGLFRRADCGLQFGAVVDFQHDDWYAESDLAQFRGEVSWLNGRQSEIGLTVATGGQDEAGTATLFDANNAVFSVTESRDSTDYYAFFYRHQLACDAGEWRVFGGFTHDSDGLFGADANLSLSPCWSLQSGFTYLIPEENNTAGGNLDEAWNVGISVVFSPWGGNRRQGNYYRPLFNVADNGSFLVDVE